VFHRGETKANLSRDVQHFYGERKNLSALFDDFKRFSPDVVLDMIPYVEQDAFTLMNTFRGIAQRVVAISSMDVYAAYGRFRRSESGEPETEPFNEGAPLRSTLYPYRSLAQDQNDFVYHYDKILVERAVMKDAMVKSTILRLPVVYGADDKQHRTIDYVKRMRDGRPAILLDEEKYQWRWSRGYVENVAEAIALAVVSEQAANRIYNVGEAEALTETEWVRSIGNALGWNGEIIAVPKDLMPKHLVEDYDYRHNLSADTSRIREELDYVEPVSHEEAVERTVTWEVGQLPKGLETGRFNYTAEDAALVQLNDQ
jgi:nucleoside-diphosphate-sugar epimerase